MSTPKPPLRAPHYGDNETYGWEMRDCAKNLISTLSWWVKAPLEFKGAANGRIWHFSGEFEDCAQLLFTSDRGDGRIELSVHDSHWVRAEVFVGDELKLGIWLEEPYEEKEFWPDGSDCKPNAEGDASGRISKRGRWLQLRAAEFGINGGDEYGYWSFDDTFD